MIWSLLFAFLIPTDPPSLPPKKERDLSGIYKVVGKDAKNGYVGAVTIVKAREVYVVTYAMMQGGSMSGVGLYEDGVLSVGWSTGARAGLTRYTHDGKNLQGRWTAWPGDGRVYRETLTFLQALELVEEDE